MQLIGRRSSVFTRLPLYFAERLQVPYEFVPIPDMKALDPDAYGGNPALKLPILRLDGATTLFGALNLCRAIADRGTALGRPMRVAWPEDAREAIARNAQELVWHGMAAQVQWVMGTVLGGLPADNLFFTKTLAGLAGSLRWLDDNLPQALAAQPAAELRLLDASLLCLVEHLVFRPTLPLEPYPRLREFAARFADDAAAQRTRYRFDS